MRTIRTLDPLLSKPIQGILTAILLERDQPWYFRDLAKRLRRTPSTLQRPLEALVQAGIVKKWMDGNRAYFAANDECPILTDLRGLLEKTCGLVEVVRVSLRRHSGVIQVAFVYGSIARGNERSGSDVDLLILGDVGLLDLSPVLSQLEQRLRRTVNAIIFSPAEFSRKLVAKNHFLQSVLAKEKMFVLGTAHDLDRLAKPRTRRIARHEQSGTRRLALSDREKPR